MSGRWECAPTRCHTLSGFVLLKKSAKALCWFDKNKKSRKTLWAGKLNTVEECQAKCVSNSKCKYFSFYHPGCWMFMPFTAQSTMWDLTIKTKDACNKKCTATKGCVKPRSYFNGYCQITDHCNYFGGTGRYERWMSTYGRGGPGTNQTLEYETLCRSTQTTLVYKLR